MNHDFFANHRDRSLGSATQTYGLATMPLCGRTVASERGRLRLSGANYELRQVGCQGQMSHL